MKDSNSVNLAGTLNIEIDQHPVKIECKGQLVELTFASFQALRKFLKATSHLRSQTNQTVEKGQLRLAYFVKDILVAEAASEFEKTWLGSYYGQDHLRVYKAKLIRSIFG